MTLFRGGRDYEEKRDELARELFVYLMKKDSTALEELGMRIKASGILYDDISSKCSELFENIFKKVINDFKRLPAPQTDTTYKLFLHPSNN